MAENRGLPISLRVIKCKLEGGDIYPPLMNIVRQMSSEIEIMRILSEEESMRWVMVVECGWWLWNVDGGFC